MAYGRLLFNNIKEYTPHFIKTVPFARTVKPVLGRGQQVSYRLNRTRSVIGMYKTIDRVFMSTPAGWNLLIFLMTFGLSSLFFFPALSVYQSNNAHRQLSVALAKEKAYKKMMEEEDDDEDYDDDDDEEDDDEEEEDDDE